MPYTDDPGAYRAYVEGSFTDLAGVRRTAGRYADRTATTDGKKIHYLATEQAADDDAGRFEVVVKESA